MLTPRQLFLQHVAQTSPSPLLLEIERAEGIYMFDCNGKSYIDLVAGVSVNNLGHCRPEIVHAVKEQAEKYMHLMVYGEFVESPQVLFAKKITELLPEKLNSVYFVNSGSEAVEAALKLAKRFTGRFEIAAFRRAYHGSSHGAASLMSEETYTQAFRPLLPGIIFLNFNETENLKQITEKTACVIVEAVQGEAGIIPADFDFMQALRKRCNETSTLLIIDEIQTGFGRTGKLFAFEHYKIIPDIITIAKAMGAGMPGGALIASSEITQTFTNNPVLGHITTFGGHPVSAAAALAGLKVLTEEKIIDTVADKENRFRKHLKHPKIKSINGLGLLLSVELENFDQILQFVQAGINFGFVTDWFLFCDSRFRISPPLTITESEIEKTCELILMALDSIS
jgi:acetylornithine/succinyldiaminopimelate/putrescine aminotransferase